MFGRSRKSIAMAILSLTLAVMCAYATVYDVMQHRWPMALVGALAVFFNVWSFTKSFDFHICRRLSFWLRFGRMKPGEWKQVSQFVWIVRWAGDKPGIIAAAQVRFPGIVAMSTVEISEPKGYWGVFIPPVVVVQEKP